MYNMGLYSSNTYVWAVYTPRPLILEPVYNYTYNTSLSTWHSACSQSWESVSKLPSLQESLASQREREEGWVLVAVSQIQTASCDRPRLTMVSMYSLYLHSERAPICEDCLKAASKRRMAWNRKWIRLIKESWNKKLIMVDSKTILFSWDWQVHYPASPYTRWGSNPSVERAVSGPLQQLRDLHDTHSPSLSLAPQSDWLYRQTDFTTKKCILKHSILTRVFILTSKWSVQTLPLSPG